MTDKEYNLQSSKLSLCESESRHREAVQKLEHLTAQLKAKEAEMKADHLRQLAMAQAEVEREHVNWLRQKANVLYNQAVLDRGFELP